MTNKIEQYIFKWKTTLHHVDFCNSSKESIEYLNSFYVGLEFLEKANGEPGLYLDTANSLIKHAYNYFFQIPEYETSLYNSYIRYIKLNKADSLNNNFTILLNHIGCVNQKHSMIKPNSPDINKIIREFLKWSGTRIEFKGSEIIAIPVDKEAFYRAILLFLYTTIKTNLQYEGNKQPETKKNQQSQPAKRPSMTENAVNQRIRPNSNVFAQNNIHQYLIDTLDVDQCMYYKDRYCKRMDSTCNPLSARCSKVIRVESKEITKNTRLPLPETKSKEKNTKTGTSKTQTPITTRALNTEMLVLSHSRRCLNSKHTLETVTAVLRVVSKYNSEIIEVKTPAFYCPECNEYILLKKDFLRIKKSGAILCPILDRTKDQKPINPYFSYDSESRIHMLGYNVSKKDNYTYRQRQLILANIMENHNIPKNEIIALIDANISTHEYRDGFEDAVAKWEVDRRFVFNYKSGDCPEIIVRKLTIGR